MPVPLLFKYILQRKMRKVFINSLHLGTHLFRILVSVIYYNALPVTKKSDNNIYVRHYIWTIQVLKKSKEVGHPNILNLKILTLTLE